MKEGITILMVEDEPLVRMSAAELLLAIGHKVIEACNADEAMAILHIRNDVDALFTDIEMPGSINGLALARLVRERWPAVVVIVTSGRCAPTAQELHSDIGFFTKPYRCEEVAKEIRGRMAIQRRGISSGRSSH